MAKRSATDQMTKENCDVADEAPERGQWKPAGGDIISGRRIVKATKRRLPVLPQSNVFGGVSLATGSPSTNPFGAISLKPPCPTTVSEFSGVSLSLTKTSTPIVSTPFTGFSLSNKSQLVKSEAQRMPMFSDHEGAPKVDRTATSPNESKRKIRSLNMAFLKWITKHVTDDPYCVLTPTFCDYNSYFKSIEGVAGSSDSDADSSQGANSQESAVGTGHPSGKTSPLLLNVPSTIPYTVISTTVTTQFTVSSHTTVADSIIPAVSLLRERRLASNTDRIDEPAASDSGTTTTSSMAPLGVFSRSVDQLPSGVVPCMLGDNTANAVTINQTDCNVSGSDTVKAALVNEEDGDRPPVPQFERVEESDAYFSKRSKLFFKKGAKFQDKGIGVVYLKRKESGSVQLLMRADTNMGNVLLNINVVPNMPIKYAKNTVTFICVPNPALEPNCMECGEKLPEPQTSSRCNKNCTMKPLPLLLKVKSEEDAKQLETELKKASGYNA